MDNQNLHYEYRSRGRSVKNRRFYDFPLVYLGSDLELIELPFPEDPYSFRLILIEPDELNVYSHFGSTKVYGVSRRPDCLDYSSPEYVPDRETYMSKQDYARKRFQDYLIRTVEEMGCIYLSSSEYALHESNWEDGQKAKWRKISIEDLRTGNFKNYPWGSYMEVGWGDLLIKK